MPNLNHKYFKNPTEGVVEYKAPTRFMSNDKSDEEKDYSRLAANFEKCIEDFFFNKSIRDSKRSLSVSKHIDYAELIFFNTFDRRSFENKYIADFGLSPVLYTELDKKVLFAVENPKLFRNFIDELNKFIDTEDHTNPKYNPNIKFIKSFAFYGSDRILSLTHLPELVSLNLIDDTAIYTDFTRIRNDLKVFLSQYRDISVLESESY